MVPFHGFSFGFERRLLCIVMSCPLRIRLRASQENICSIPKNAPAVAMKSDFGIHTAPFLCHFLYHFRLQLVTPRLVLRPRTARCRIVGDRGAGVRRFRKRQRGTARRALIVSPVFIPRKSSGDHQLQPTRACPFHSSDRREANRRSRS